MTETPAEEMEHHDATDVAVARQALRQKWVEQAEREAVEHDRRVRRFLLGVSLANWGVAVVAWMISAYLGITSPASIIVYSVLFVIGLVAAIIAILTYLLEKFGHEPRPYAGNDVVDGPGEDEEELGGTEAPATPQDATAGRAAKAGGVGASAAAPAAVDRLAARAPTKEANAQREAAPSQPRGATSSRDVRQPPRNAAPRHEDAAEDAAAGEGAATGDAPPPAEH